MVTASSGGITEIARGRKPSTARDWLALRAHHRHFGIPGSIQKQTLVYTVILGLILTAFFDLSRIAAPGIVFYLIMDIAIHWGVIRYLREDVQARAWVPVTAIVLNLHVLGGFVWVKLNSDPFVIGVAVVTMVVIATGE